MKGEDFFSLNLEHFLATMLVRWDRSVWFLKCWPRHLLFNVEKTHLLGTAGGPIIVSVFFDIKKICDYSELGKQTSIRSMNIIPHIVIQKGSASWGWRERHYLCFVPFDYLKYSHLIRGWRRLDASFRKRFFTFCSADRFLSFLPTICWTCLWLCEKAYGKGIEKLMHSTGEGGGHGVCSLVKFVVHLLEHREPF